MEALLTTVSQTLLTVLVDVGPMISDASKLGTVITTLEQLIPFAQSVGLALIGPIQNAISILEGADGLTDDQVTQLDAIKATADAAYAKAWAAYSAAHPDPNAA